MERSCGCGGPGGAASQAEVNTAVRTLRRQGFALDPRFPRTLARLGVRFDPVSFGRVFRQAGHYRLAVPGDVRAAVLPGAGIVYRTTPWSTAAPTLLAAVDPLALPSLVVLSAPARPDLQPPEELEVFFDQLRSSPGPAPWGRIAIAEVKGIRSAPDGLRQLMSRRYPSVPGKDLRALIVYDDAGNMRMTVWSGWDSDQHRRRVVWAGCITPGGCLDRSERPDVGTTSLGAVMERAARDIFIRNVGSSAAIHAHRTNASGPDIVASTVSVPARWRKSGERIPDDAFLRRVRDPGLRTGYALAIADRPRRAGRVTLRAGRAG